MTTNREAINQIVQFLTDEFIVEECVGNITEGCLSCEMIEARASLRKVLELMDAGIAEDAQP